MKPIQPLGANKMLVLTRKPGQAFQVGPDVRIKVIRVSRNRVRIGIEAPAETRVTREELLPLPDNSQQTQEATPTPR